MAAPKFKANIQTSRPENDLDLIQRIGSGTYGEVYKAHVKATGALAAVKIINIEPGDDFDIIQQEIMIMQDCKHKNIVQYHGSYLRRDKLWIAMEFCGGGSLQDVYHVTGALTEQMIAFSSAEMLKGLQYMHGQLKLHRDIKGANVLMTTDGDIKLADFGVGAQITSTIGKRSSFIGTPYWMAPEVAAVERTGGYDHLCDIWAVGITAIELAECQPPLFELHPMRALYLISKKNYTPPTLKEKNKWSSQFKDFLKQSLKKDPKKRPDAERLLQLPFLSDKRNVRQLLRDLLDKYDRMKQKKKNNKHVEEYISDDEKPEEDVKEEPTKEQKAPTVRRIQSKKDKKNKNKDFMNLPGRGDSPEVTGNSTIVADGASSNSQDRVLESTDSSTIKAAPKKELPPPPKQPPPQPAQLPPQPAQRPAIPRKFKDSSEGAVPPPLPPRDTDTGRKFRPEPDIPTLTDRTVLNPPPLPPRVPGGGVTPPTRPQSQLFTQKASKNCFSKIFNECPLNMFDAASWTHPETKQHHLLFATDEGIYSFNVDDPSNVEMIQIFSRPCKWVYVLKNICVSVCGATTTSVYMHNLLSLHGQQKETQERKQNPKGVTTTTKVPGTANTQKCCVVHNPYNDEIYLYAGREGAILILQWYEPLEKFMIVRDIQCTLPPTLQVFEPIVIKGAEHTSICVGAYLMANGDILIDKLDIEAGANWEAKTGYKPIELKSFSQLEPNIILVAFDKQVMFVDVEGKRLNFASSITHLHFDHPIEDAICLPGSVLTFSTHGMQGKSLHDKKQQTAHFQDPLRVYKLLCSDRIVVIESRETKDNHSNLYILANEQTPFR